MKKTKSFLVLVFGIAAISSYYTFFDSFGTRAADTATVSGTVTSGITLGVTPTTVSFPSSFDGFVGGAAKTIDGITMNVKTNGNYNLKLKKNHYLCKESVADTCTGTTTTQFEDIITSGSPIYDWSVGNNERKFGFSLKSVDSGITPADRYLNDGSGACNYSGGTLVSDKCWDYFPTSDVVIASGTPTTASGSNTVIKINAQIGTVDESASDYLEAGAYTTIITATATLNP